MDIMEYAFENSEKKPLDHIALDGGMCGIFRTIGCIGDSLSSGEFQVPAPADSQIPWRWIDCFEYSWGQYIARHTRSKVYNFSHGGITARHYWEHFAEEQGFWETDKLCQQYEKHFHLHCLLHSEQ